jgi:plasmid stabilization system protein ParE
MRIVWSASALRDLAVIRERIAAENPAAAERQIRLVLAAISRLASFPQVGRKGRIEGPCELVGSRTPYVVPYRLRENTIEIARVLHARQRWPERL